MSFGRRESCITFPGPGVFRSRGDQTRIRPVEAFHSHPIPSIPRFSFLKPDLERKLIIPQNQVNSPPQNTPTARCSLNSNISPAAARAIPGGVVWRVARLLMPGGMASSRSTKRDSSSCAFGEIESALAMRLPAWMVARFLEVNNAGDFSVVIGDNVC